MDACGIDLILNAEVSGTSATHIGSARIITGSNTQASFRVMMGPTSEVTSSLEVKRFTGGTSILEMTASGTGLQDISGSGTSVVTLGLVNDWYDFYASGSSLPSQGLIKGIRIILQ